MPGSRAIFISYAREDLDAASNIANSLRAAGLEVWLDLTELRGGDAWDGKIKRQIRECTLFLPLISQRTQSRREGYFRLEWLLADERSRLMARGTPFLVPVVIDDTGEREALVPDSFLAVQWTRLPAGTASAAFAERAAALLRDEPEAGPHSSAKSPPPAAIPRRRSAGIWGIAAAALAAGALALWHPWTPRVADAMPDFPVNPDLRRAWNLIQVTDVIPEDYALAKDITQGVLSQKPTDPEAVTVMACIQNALIFRGFDSSPQAFANAARYAERASQLAPNNAYAQGALGVYLYMQATDLARAVQVLDVAIQKKPDEAFFYRERDDALFVDPKVTTAAAIASAEATAARFPNNALVQYELSRHYRDVGRIADMERALDRALAIAPVVNALVWKARVSLWVRGDPEEMKSILDRVPSRGQSLERVVIGRWMYAMVTGKADYGLAALAGLPETWVDDYDFVGPKALLEATLLDRAGRHEVALLRCTAALAEIKRREAETPGDTELIAIETWCLQGLGQIEAARVLSRTLNETVQRPYRIGFGNSWWFSPIAVNLLLGDRATAVQLIREAATEQTTGSGNVVSRRGSEVTRDGYPTNFRQVLYEDLRIDPRMAPWRDDPEIKSILAPAADTAPGS
jgi:tetratricopeptide (TPR) repeat protein